MKLNNYDMKPVGYVDSNGNLIIKEWTIVPENKKENIMSTLRKKKTAMISLPMTGRTSEEIKAHMEEVKAKLEADGYKVVDTYLTEKPGKEVANKDVWYIGKSIVLLANADVLYMVKGWEASRGCKIEHQIAQEYNTKVIYE